MDLELVETQALVVELFKRFDHCVFAGVKDHSDGKQTMAGSAHGNPFMVAGVCQLIASDGLKKWQKTSLSQDASDL